MVNPKDVDLRGEEVISAMKLKVAYSLEGKL